MKLLPKNNIEFLQQGGCFLYYFDEDPKCILTTSLVESDKELDFFDDIREKVKYIKNDCGGNIKNCPYIQALWNLNQETEEEKIEEIIENLEEIEQEDVVDEQLLKFGNITIDFDYSWPIENPIITDAIVIPTDSKLQFYKYVDFGEDNNASILQECRKRQLIFKAGESLITKGGSTGYPKIAHSIICDPGDITVDIDNMGASLYDALSKLEDDGCSSIAISPLVIVDKDIIVPNVDLYLKVCLITIMSLIADMNIKNILYILIYIPPNFMSNLQEVIHDVNNIS